jgi:hypothetical protein
MGRDRAPGACAEVNSPRFMEYQDPSHSLTTKTKAAFIGFALRV